MRERRRQVTGTGPDRQNEQTHLVLILAHHLILGGVREAVAVDEVLPQVVRLRLPRVRVVGHRVVREHIQSLRPAYPCEEEEEKREQGEDKSQSCVEETTSGLSPRLLVSESSVWSSAYEYMQDDLRREPSHGDQMSGGNSQGKQGRLW